MAAAIMLLAALWTAYNYKDLKGNAAVGTAYAAHIACSCRYIEGRSLEDCKKDFEPGMEMIAVSDDPEKQRVTASVTFLAKSVAEKRGSFGCLNLNAEEMKAL